jgi:hypothetical protein
MLLGQLQTGLMDRAEYDALANAEATPVDSLDRVGPLKEPSLV